MRTRAARDARRFVGGFLVGVTFAALMFITALALGLLTPSVDWSDPWPDVLDREARVAENRDIRRIAETAAEHRTMAGLLELAGRDDLLTRFVGPTLPTTAADLRAARLLQDDLGRRMRTDLEAWDADLGRLRLLSPRARRAALHVLAIGRWQLEGGELEQAVRSYERRLAALPAPTPTPMPTPMPVEPEPEN